MPCNCAVWECMISISYSFSSFSSELLMRINVLYQFLLDWTSLFLPMFLSLHYSLLFQYLFLYFSHVFYPSSLPCPCFRTFSFSCSLFRTVQSLKWLFFFSLVTLFDFLMIWNHLTINGVHFREKYTMYLLMSVYYFRIG